MKIELIETNGSTIAEIVSDEIVLKNQQDALDLIANCCYQGATGILIYEKNIIPAFFDLKTGIAGEILQKFSTYRCQLAIVGEFTKYHSKSLNDFIVESNKTQRINFVSNYEVAKTRLLKSND
jgi:hypothetical protein